MSPLIPLLFPTACVLLLVVIFLKRGRLFGWYITKSSEQKDVMKALEGPLYDRTGATCPCVLRVRWTPGVLRRLFGYKPKGFSYARIGSRWYRLPEMTPVSQLMDSSLSGEEMRLFRKESAVKESHAVDALTAIFHEARQRETQQRVDANDSEYIPTVDLARTLAREAIALEAILANPDMYPLNESKHADVETRLREVAPPLARSFLENVDSEKR